MTTHWPCPRGQASLGQPHQEIGRSGRFELAFARHGSRTHVGRQFVSYPFHMTRPFALDAAIPSLLTIYQQSSSGGLYRGDQLASRYELGAAAAAHITTQAATIVHDCQGQPAHQATEIFVGEGAFLALTPDPMVLFPGAACSTTLHARLAQGAVLLISDAFACHDPEGQSRPFDHLNSDVRIEDHSGRLMVRDCFRIAGEALVHAASPIGGWRVVTNFMLLGDYSRLPTREALTEIAPSPAMVSGVTELPNRAGWGVRCLAANAISVRIVSERLFSLSVEAAFGAFPALRRK